MYCLGVSNHSPLTAIDFLLKTKTIDSRKDIQIVEVGTVLPAKPKRKALALVNIQDFLKNAKTLNSAAYNDTIVVVFASALRIRELQNCFALDSEPTKESGGVVVRTTKMSRVRLRQCLKTSHNDVFRQDRKFLITLIDSVKSGSLLNPLMTFIYTLSSSTHQTPVKEACAAFFHNGLSFDAMIRMLKKKYGVTLTERQSNTLSGILEGETGKSFRNLFKDYRASKSTAGDKAVNLDSLCKKHGTAIYEVRYLLSVVGESVERGTAYRGKSVTKITHEETTARAQKKAAPAKPAKDSKPKAKEDSKPKAKKTKPVVNAAKPKSKPSKKPVKASGKPKKSRK